MTPLPYALLDRICELGETLDEQQLAALAELLRHAEGADQRDGLARHARMLLGAAEERVAALSGPALIQAEEALRLAQIGYAAGKFSLIELIDAQAALTATRKSLIDARLDRARALAALIRANAQ